MNHSKIKGLQGRVDYLRNGIDMDKRVIKTRSEDMSRKQKELKDIEEKLKDVVSGREGVVISEHALLRYIERAKGINLSDIEQEILTGELVDFWRENGAACDYKKDGLVYVIRRNIVVTIRPDSPEKEQQPTT